MLDIVDRRRHLALVIRRNAVRHFAGRQTVVGPDHADDGHLDIREDIGPHVYIDNRSDEQDQYCHHHEGVRPA
ncbi:conserved hypothetical protein [Ricinus communis]|uniref:Uncharacterized protein n=1 Tax=Ricinus communis TaxID=3988 RepID=B9TMX9_RICCO|nr:conserved hypothetical protein [Ricinus communis]